MMFYQTVLVSFLVISCGQFSSGFPLESAVITEYENEIENAGYHYSFKTSDNTSQQQSGTISEDGILRVTGSYYYMTPDGNLQFVEYTADEKGYHPKTSVIQSQNVDAFLKKKVQIQDEVPIIDLRPKIGPAQGKRISSALLASLQG